MKTTDFAQHISFFLSRHLPNQKGASKNTINSYRDTFVLFLHFAEQTKKIPRNRLTIKMMTREMVIEFLDWLQNTRKSSNVTRNTRLAAIHSFFDYLQYENLENIYECQRIKAIKYKRKENKSINYLSIDGIKLLLKQPDITTSKGKRDLALLSLMYDSGVRVQEVIDLTPSAINIQKQSTIRVVGKGNKARLIPLLNAQVKNLVSYLIELGLNKPQAGEYPLFNNGRNEMLTRAGVSFILKKYAIMARNENPVLIPETISPHSLRHSKAMHLLQAGVPLIYIRDILGHVSVQTTEIYARIDTKHKFEIMQNIYVDIVPNEECPKWQNNDILTWLKSF
ncbi:tyrosine-type recombinase/integrase [Odoribacter laneus]|uniref:Integrase n=1 Tax=Odoribacter laneus YIT 12061 TaxID=742817 RepID=H1DE30_9BACT|nr:tyrosine-type recombinase/integrase [Odoribacter laneus]EHP50827.1 hypothetical protein HMPREF9449_00516 [Odoribacter laneus YIT 12061]